MDVHIQKQCQSMMAQLKNIADIRNYLEKQAAEKLVHAFVGSRLDYCNSLLVGIPVTFLAKLQRVQNIAARILTGTRKYDHMTPVLYKLHWLPVKYRIEYKIILMTYRALNGLAPITCAILSTSKIIMVSRRSKTCGASYPFQILWGQSILSKGSKFMEFTPPVYENNVIDVHIQESVKNTYFSNGICH